MSERQLELAREFCEKVGAQDLLAYLGLDATATTEEAQAALKAQRRKMQGQQSNPKYKDEARQLIRQFQTLDAVLASPAAHLEDMAKSRESVHLPILEMTIKGVLAGGPLSRDQEDYLRANAKELGVSNSTFDDLLRRLQKHGTLSPAKGRVNTPPPSPGALKPVPSRRDGPVDLDAETVDDSDSKHKNTANLLPPSGSSKSKRRQKSREGSSQRTTSNFARTPIVPPPRTTGTGVPSSPRDIDPLGGVTTSAATAPPIRSRSAGSNGAATSKAGATDPSTVRRRVDSGAAGAGSASMEVVGQPSRDIEIIGRKAAQLTIRVRLLGELPVAARVVPDDPWVTVVPQRLSPTQREHLVRVTVHPDRMFEDQDETTIRLFNDLGEQIEVSITARRKTNWSGLGMGIAIASGIVALGLAAFLAVQILMSSSTAGSLTIRIDPSSEAVLLDGSKIGSGPLIRLDEPPMGPHRLTIVQESFETYENTITLDRDEDRVLNVELELVDKLDFEPHPDDTPGNVADDPGMWAELETRMTSCLNKTPKDTSPYSGQVLITLRADGRAGSVQVIGNDPLPAPVRTCLRRQGATVSYTILDGGSYAKLMVDFAYPVSKSP